MNRLKKFWITFLSFLPFTAGAAAPFIVGGIAGVGVIAGFSIYRSSAPVDMNAAYSFFSSCWSCQMFADIMATMSNMLPRIYSALGHVIIPFAVMLSAIWFAWRLVDNFLNQKVEQPWSVANTFTTHLLKLAFVSTLLVAPLPRLISEIAIEPIFNVGLSLNRAVVHDDQFDACVVATAIADPVSIDERAANRGAFSPKLRHNLACELAGVHQMTGLGMTVGWTMMNMAFDSDYMHEIMWGIPIFPNVIMLFGGLAILVLFFMALLPIPLYFLEIFITLSLDLIMLPLMLLAWLFKGWKISLAGAGNTIRGIIDYVISGTLGLAVTGIFVAFAIMFLNAIFGDWAGAPALATALTNNDSKFLMDALMMRNDSLVTIILMGIFIAMFMTMIPALSKTLFSVQISNNFYDTTKKNMEIVWKNLKKWYDTMKK
ncbi:MAG: hypothetical protein E7008_02345 [Alphaproteobacteria bacterium]|nr:hypothetical protein [Alphaproteobacteria bacterium]